MANWTSTTHGTTYAKLSVKPRARAWGQGCCQAGRERSFLSGLALHSLRVNKMKSRQRIQFCETQTLYNLGIHFKKKSTKLQIQILYEDEYLIRMRKFITTNTRGLEIQVPFQISLGTLPAMLTYTHFLSAPWPLPLSIPQAPQIPSRWESLLLPGLPNQFTSLDKTRCSAICVKDANDKSTKPNCRPV